MNDYEFGNYIFDMRNKHGLSQAQLASKIGISNKAVSKWENGNSKPTTDTIRKLATLFNVSVDELLKIRKGKHEMQITKIAITGGPCGGKSTAMSWVQNAFTQRGYTVLFVSETATELIGGGVAPWTCRTNIDYQKCQVKLQIEKERIFMQAAQTMDCEKVLIVCDRGVLDNRAYMDELEFTTVVNSVDSNEVELRDNYDAVFHLVSAAKGAEEFYTLGNNVARTETVEEAVALDDKLIFAWTGHPHLRVIDNSTGFEDKMRRLITEIACFLGEPEPYEIERKFLIEYPDVRVLESLPNCRKVDIIQTYLTSPDADTEVRIRQRGSEGNYIYFKTEKRRITDVKRVEVERRLSKSEYLELMMSGDTSLRQIRKTRYCLMFGRQYLEIDIYPFWNKQAVVEIELSSEDEKIVLPDFLKVIDEVTEDERYGNHSLAKKVPEESI